VVVPEIRIAPIVAVPVVKETFQDPDCTAATVLLEAPIPTVIPRLAVFVAKFTGKAAVVVATTKVVPVSAETGILEVVVPEITTAPMVAELVVNPTFPAIEAVPDKRTSPVIGILEVVVPTTITVFVSPLTGRRLVVVPDTRTAPIVALPVVKIMSFAVKLAAIGAVEVKVLKLNGGREVVVAIIMAVRVSAVTGRRLVVVPTAITVLVSPEIGILEVVVPTIIVVEVSGLVGKRLVVVPVTRTDPMVAVPAPNPTVHVPDCMAETVFDSGLIPKFHPPLCTALTVLLPGAMPTFSAFAAVFVVMLTCNGLVGVPISAPVSELTRMTLCAIHLRQNVSR